MSVDRRLWWLFVAVAILVVSGAGDWAFDAVFHSWTIADPPLLDEWAGQLTTGNGKRLGISITLRRAISTSGGRLFCRGCALIQGDATTCDAEGNVLRYRLSGSPSDRQGRRLRLGATPDRDAPPDGLELSVLAGTWDGADAMTMRAEFFWRRGRSAISATDDPATQPVPVRMLRKAPGQPVIVCATVV